MVDERHKLLNEKILVALMAIVGINVRCYPRPVAPAEKVRSFPLPTTCPEFPCPHARPRHDNFQTARAESRAWDSAWRTSGNRRAGQCNNPSDDLKFYWELTHTPAESGRSALERPEFLRRSPRGESC